MLWQLKTRKFENLGQLGRPLLMGIVNATPDSFSDGGRFFEPDRAVRHGLRLLEDGMDILDVGGESTRPGAEPVSVEDEIRRIVPVVHGLLDKTGGGTGGECVVSVDTSKSAVARAAINVGAEIVNDISGCTFDPEMIDLLRETGAGVCLMHIRGTPKTMQSNPEYPDDDPIPTVFEFLRARIGALIARGISPDAIVVDPGLGFGKTFEHNERLIRGIKKFHELGRPILVGHSRKGFLKRMYPDLDRDAATAALSRFLISQGVQILRIHSR